MTRLRAGVIGLGVGTQHALTFAAHDAVDLVAVCDHDPAKLRDAQEKWPGVQTYQSAEALLISNLDLVVIASYDQDHAWQIIQALDSGKHVFAEKPLCLTNAELDAIEAALKRNPGRRLSSNTILRRSPRFMALKDAIADGRFGRLFTVEADYVYGRLHKLTQGWRSTCPGYSVMLGGGIHMVDLILWLTGGRVVEVIAYGNRIASQTDGVTLPINDLTVALLRFEDGLISKISANFGSVHPHYHRVLVYGTAATFENRLGPAELWTSRDPSTPPALLDMPYPGMHKGDLIPSFIGGIRGIGRPLVEEADVFATMRVCLAIDQSVAQQRAIALT